MASKTLTFKSGPWRGVRTTDEPFDDQSDLLNTATNAYFPEPITGSGCYSRPGMLRPQSVANGGNRGQGAYAHVALDGTVYNFLFVNGKVWRWSTDLSSAPVDVTPTNIVQSATAPFVFATSLADSIIVSDGVNKMWIGTNLGSTPITATVIEQQTPSTALSIGSNDVRLANAAFTYTYRAGASLGQQATFAANATGTAIGALGQIAANTWGSILVELNTSSGALVFTFANAAGAGYATEALAIAALPARTATNWYVGYVTVRADAGAVWIAGTDAFATGTTGNQAQTTNYYAGEGPTYAVFGPPVIYTGAVFVIYQQVATVYARTTIGWSEPNEPGVGYQQTDYDNQWTLTQTASDPLYALAPTNDAIYYARRGSWGAIAGAPGVNFQGTATHDVVSGNVGCIAPASVCVVLNYVYFLDAQARPWRFSAGGTPTPIWWQVRGNVGPIDESTVAGNAWGVVDPNLNVYLCAVPTGTGAAVFRAFDVATGRAFGNWGLPSDVAITAVGVVRNATGSPRVALLQANAANLCYVWYLTGTEQAIWGDNNTGVVNFTANTGWLAYSAGEMYQYTEARCVFTQQAVAAGLTGTFTTAGGNTQALVNRIPDTADASGPRRARWLLEQQRGRGAQFSILTSGTAAQQKLFRLEFDAVQSVSVQDDY